MEPEQGALLSNIGWEASAPEDRGKAKAEAEICAESRRGREERKKDSPRSSQRRSTEIMESFSMGWDGKRERRGSGIVEVNGGETQEHSQE